VRIVVKLVNLQDLTVPIGVDDFLAHVWGRKFQHFEGAPERFDELFGWDDLNDILAAQRLSDSQLQILWGEKQVHHSTYTTSSSARGYHWQTVRPERINTLLANGATLRLRQVDQLHHRVGELAARLERELLDRIRVNAYVNCGPAERSAIHHDDHDVIVLQVDGVKHWRLYGLATPQPLPDDGNHAPVAMSDAPHDPAAELQLRKGDVLYIPRGFWHSAEAVDGPSLHLTVGIWRATGIDLLEWIVTGLRKSELLRADIPRRAEEAHQRQYLAQVREMLLAQLAKPDLLQRMFEARDSREPADIGFALPIAAHKTPASALTNSHTIRLLARRAVLEPDGDYVVLRAGGQVHRYGAQLTHILEQLVVGDPLSVSAAISLCDSAANAADIRDMLGSLLSNGLAEIA
jgi:ribosomal protein L16 Arg81 hydroxylase